MRSLVLLMVLLTGGAVGVWSVMVCEGAQPGPDVEDLALIPASAQGFLSVRLADLWKTPAVQKGVVDARKRDLKCEDPADRMEKEFGLKPGEVERVSFVYSAERLPWGVVRTLKPYDRRKILSRLPGAKQAVHQGKQYYTGADKQGRQAAVWLASPRVVVVGTDEGVKSCIALAAAPIPKGSLQPIIALCKGKHHSVVGLDGKRLDGLKGNLLLSWVTPIQLAWATVDVGKEDVELSIHAQAADEKQARRLHHKAAASVLLTPVFLSAKMDVDVAWELSFVVRGVKARQDGREVIARSRGDASRLIAEVVLLACGSSALKEEEGLLLQVRSPFGVHRVETALTHAILDDKQYPTRRLLHGFTLHAKQFREDGLRDMPLSYYHGTGPVGQVFRAYNTDPKRAFAVIDLGAGTMASYGLPRQTVDFYELDPELARISFDTNEYFTFVEDAQRRGVDVNLVLGNARLTFMPKGTNQRLKPLQARKGESNPRRKYGTPIKANFKYRLILVDTLSPDAVPGCLVAKITKQAVKGYFDRLEDDGIVLIHISSRHFDLRPVLANIAVELGVVGYHLSDDNDEPPGKNRSHWVALTRKPKYLAKVLAVPRWTRHPGQLKLLGMAAWPTGGSAGLQALAGMCHAGQAVMDLHAQKAHKAEGRPGDPRRVRTEWAPLDTTPELRRIEALAAKEIRDLTARIGALQKELDKAPRDLLKKALLDDRIASLEKARGKLERKLEIAAEQIRRNAKVGIWTDDSSDLIELFSR